MQRSASYFWSSTGKKCFSSLEDRQFSFLLYLTPAMKRVLMKWWSFILIPVSLLILADCKPSVGGPSDDDHDDLTWSAGSDFDDKVSTYEDENRDIWQKPVRVIDLLSPLENKTIADLGAGTGYFAFRLVAKAKKVIAIDIDRDFVRFLNDKKALLPSDYQDRFEVRMAKADDPMLVPGEVDGVLVVNTYAYLENRVEYFRNLAEMIVPGGKVVIIEFKMKNIPNGPPPEEKVPMGLVEKELEQAGFDKIKVDDQTLDYQYIVVAEI